MSNSGPPSNDRWIVHQAKDGLLEVTMSQYETVLCSEGGTYRRPHDTLEEARNYVEYQMSIDARNLEPGTVVYGEYDHIYIMEMDAE